MISLAAVFWLATALAGCQQADPIIESTSRLGNTTDTIGPYLVETVVVNVGRGDKVEVFYNVNDQGQFIPLRMEEQANGELFIGAIPGRPAGSRITYYVAVTDSDGKRLVTDPVGAGALPYSFLVTD